MDLESYVERVQSGECFICEMVTDERARSDEHVIFENDRYIAFLNRFPTLYGYTLMAPREHRTRVTADFSIEEYLDLQAHLHAVAEAVRLEAGAERIYLLSLGSDQGNAHVHWHVAPLPPGTPYERQQFEALRAENGVLDIPTEERSAFAARVRARILERNL